tara:strand:- start:287514 stop:288704 length:1191 start_codon:yes stop_codon:yes gene_type:complete
MSVTVKDDNAPDDIDLKALFNGKSKPLVMAYIGQDDPHRGDSHGTIGICKAIAEMIGGDYVYVDEAAIKNHFNDAADYKDGLAYRAHLSQYLAQFAKPAFLLGRYSTLETDSYFKRAGIYESGFMGVNNSVNEVISTWNGQGDKKLVAHDLTPELLERESHLFSQKNPNITGPLVGVFMAGDPDHMPPESLKTLKDVGLDIPQEMCPRIDLIAKKLAGIATHYDALTYFIVPCRRTGKDRYESFRNDLEAQINIKMAGVNKKIQVVGQDYDTAIGAYNPYRGLIGRADHLAVIGYSLSMVSELLYAGKNIYLSDKRLYALGELEAQGYIQDILSLEDAAFPTRNLPRQDITPLIARNMVFDYLKGKDMRGHNGELIYSYPIMGGKDAESTYLRNAP